MRSFPGFDAVRLFAALSVVFSHSFLIADAVEDNEPFQAATGEILGVYAVFVFFIISGLLISESALRSRSMEDFLRKRALRILPALFVCNAISALLIAPWFAPEGPRAFLAMDYTWTEFLRVSFFSKAALYYQHTSFFPPPDAAPWLPHMLNGVLWSVRIEFLCYLFVGAMWVLGWIGWRGLVAGAVAIAAMALPPFAPNDVPAYVMLAGPCFLAGMALRELPADYRASGGLALASFAVLAGLALLAPFWAGQEWLLFPLFAAYPLFWMGQQDFRVLRPLHRWGDPSYGIYLWGWPITMVIRSWVGPDAGGYLLAALATPPTILAGYLSWHLVERPLQRLGRPRRPAGDDRLADPAIGTGSDKPQSPRLSVRRRRRPRSSTQTTAARP